MHVVAVLGAVALSARRSFVPTVLVHRQRAPTRRPAARGHGGDRGLARLQEADRTKQPQKQTQAPTPEVKPEGVSHDENKKPRREEGREEAAKKPDEASIRSEVPPQTSTTTRRSASRRRDRRRLRTAASSGFADVTKGDPSSGACARDMHFDAARDREGRRRAGRLHPPHRRRQDRRHQVQGQKARRRPRRPLAEAALEAAHEGKRNEQSRSGPDAPALQLTTKWLCFKFTVKQRVVAVLRCRARRCARRRRGRAMASSSTSTATKKGNYPIALPTAPDGDAAAKEIAQVESFDLSVAGVFKVLDPQSFLADLKAEGIGIDPQKWKDVGALRRDQVQGDAPTSIDFRLYEVCKGTNAVAREDVQARRHRHAARSSIAWCNEVVKYYTGEAGFFGSKIAFTAKGKGRARSWRWTSTATAPTRSRTTARRTSCRRGRRRAARSPTRASCAQPRSLRRAPRAAVARRRSAASAA